MNQLDTEGHELPLELLPWYVNGSLEAVERRQVEAHLQDCESCANEVQDLRRIASGIGEESMAPLVPDPPVDDFLSQLDSDVVSTQNRGYPAWPWSIAASLVAAAIMIWMMSDSRQSGDSLEFEAVTDGQIATLSYVYTLDIENDNRAAAERAIVDRMPGASLSQAGDEYRLVVSMPSKTVSELNELARTLENIDGVERAALVGVQLPVE